MSRIGKQPILIPNGVTITETDNQIVVNGAKGTLNQFKIEGINIKQENNELIVSRDKDDKPDRSKHGLLRSLINNMVIGVSEGFSKKLEINGVGYKVAPEGQNLKFALGFSHDVLYKVPDGIKTTIEQNTIIISGIDKQQVGQVAAEIRALKKPEPYKGKGIKYSDERILRKSGKSGKEK